MGFFQRRCVQQHPGRFAVGIMAGVAGTLFAVVAVTTTVNVYTPFHRPALQLESSVVEAGGHMGFEAAVPPAKACPQEQTRVLWKWDETKKRRRIYPLSDANPIPRLSNDPMIVMVSVPRDVPPGDYYYARQSQTWCSWVNHVFGPTIESTRDVPVRIVSPVTQ
jgi:hypothetical protein